MSLSLWSKSWIMALSCSSTEPRKMSSVGVEFVSVAPIDIVSHHQWLQARYARYAPEPRRASPRASTVFGPCADVFMSSFESAIIGAIGGQWGTKSVWWCKK